MSDMIEQLNEDKRHGMLSNVTLGEVYAQLQEMCDDNDAQEELMNAVTDYLTSE